MKGFEHEVGISRDELYQKNKLSMKVIDKIESNLPLTSEDIDKAVENLFLPLNTKNGEKYIATES